MRFLIFLKAGPLHDTGCPVLCGVKKFLIIGEKVGLPMSGSGPAFEKIKNLMG